MSSDSVLDVFFVSLFMIQFVMVDGSYRFDLIRVKYDRTFPVCQSSHNF